MTFTCPTCGQEMPQDLLVIIPHTDEHIIEVIKKKHPDWEESKGVCKKCYEYLKKELHPE